MARLAKQDPKLLGSWATFLGHVIDYNVDLQSRFVRAKRLILLQGFYDIIEEVEAPLPVFISIDPSYKALFNTVSQKLVLRNIRKKQDHGRKLQAIPEGSKHTAVGIDPKLVGLPAHQRLYTKLSAYQRQRLAENPKLSMVQIVINLQGWQPTCMRRLEAW